MTRIVCGGMNLTGMIDVHSNEGLFTYAAWQYAGQIKDGQAQGKGVWRWGSEELSGDWVAGHLTGYGLGIYDSGLVYHGQMQSGFPQGYGEWAESKITYQGQWVEDYKHGPIRRTAADGSVNDTMWEFSKDTMASCDADDAVKKAQEGIHVCSNK